ARWPRKQCGTPTGSAPSRGRCLRLHSQLRLLGLRFGLRTAAGRPLAEPVARGHPRDPPLELLLVVARREVPARVQRGIPWREDGELARDEVEVVVTDLAVDLERTVTERRRAGFAGGARGAVERLLGVADAR